MPTVISFVSQKGGVGKSTLTRALAREAAANGLKVKVADLDADQGTIIDWHRLRVQRQIEPSLAVELFKDAGSALKQAHEFDLLIIDGPAKASASTADIARRSDLVVQPTGASRDDLLPAVRVFHALSKLGIPTNKLVFALNRIGTEAEADAAREYLVEAGYEVLNGHMLERPGYRTAQNEGLAVTETRFAALNGRADALVQALTDRVA